MDDAQSGAKGRTVHAPDPTRGAVPPHTLDDISAMLEEHARQIETLVAANKVLEERNAAFEERCKALDRKSKSLERSCGELEVRCSSLERSVQVLKKDVDWTYSAPDIPRSHWIEQGHDEEYADYMVGNISYIKDNVEDIRSSGGGNCSCLDYYGQSRMLYDDALLPHFKELADAIQLSTGIRKIFIDNIELRPSALGILFPAMEGKATNIDMRRIRFPAEDVDECYEIIAASIRRNIKLEKFDWESIEFRSDEQADLFIESVMDNWAIKIVTLANCINRSDINGCRALASLMMCGRPLKIVDFRDNGLSGIDDVAAALATNPQLKELWIRDNEFNDGDAELIAEALKQNTNLQSLYMRGNNNITPTGFEKIRTAIYNPLSLNGVASCNHTCWVDCIRDNDQFVGNYSGMTPQQRRRRKLYNFLSSRHAVGSNARHLNAELGEGAFVTKLVPRVLECIEQCSGDRRSGRPTPLSICYELMRSWKMPELFELRGSI